jgi:hypothetical protein
MDKITTAIHGVIALLPIPAQSPAAEIYNWLTDISDSRDGTEERLQLRTAPRATIEYAIPRNADERARAFNDEYGAIRTRWGVPLWAQAERVGAVASSDTTITCESDLAEYADESLALVWQSSSLFAVVQVATVGVGVLNLEDPVGVTFTDAVVMPLRVGFISGDASAQRTGYNDIGNIRYDIEDNVALTVSAPTQFLSNDIYFDELLKGGPSYISAIQAASDEADYSLGKIGRLAPWTYARQLSSVQRILEGPEEAFAFRQWLHRRAGKYRAFWTPSFENDMRVANTGTITTTLQFSRDSYDEWATARTHIAIEDTGGNWYARTLSSVSVVNATTLQGTLNSTINLAASRVRRISYLGLKRLSSDSMKLEWIGNGVARCNFGILEISP